MRKVTWNSKAKVHFLGDNDYSRRVAALPGKTWAIIVIPYKAVDTSDRKLKYDAHGSFLLRGIIQKPTHWTYFPRKKCVNTRLWLHDDITG
jgi:hypothetical protein